MKNIIYLFLTALIVVMCSCSSKSSRVEYLPCQVDEYDDWSFVNAKGEVFCRECFSECPSEVRDGIFFVEENEAYSMYQFDTKEPKLLLEDISSYGKMSDGLVPICKNDSHIEIVNPKGVTQFIVDKINGQKVKSCAPSFKNGYLLVLSEDDNENSFYSIIDKSGKVVLPPMYDDLRILGKGLFFARYDDNGEEWSGIIDKKGKKIAQWDDENEVEYITEKYIVAKNSDGYYIFDITGKEVLRCPSKVKYIMECEDDFFVFHDGSDYGVMNVKGEIILPTKYRNIEIVKDVFVAQKRTSENKNLQVFNKEGELIADIEESEYAQDIVYVDEFGYVLTGDYDCVLDTAFKPVKNLEFEAIHTPEEYEDISSEYKD